MQGIENWKGHDIGIKIRIKLKIRIEIKVTIYSLCQKSTTTKLE